MSKDYGSADIKELKFPDNVRKKVGMYLGDSEQGGFFHSLTEIFDNSLDEFGAGYGKKIVVTVDSKKNRVTIQDNGRGIPFHNNSDGVSALVLAMTTLHAGGKHENSLIQKPGEKASYKYSSGINGVGASVVNGVSDYFHVKSVRGKEVATITWENGLIKEELKIEKNTEKLENGTFVDWIPSVKSDDFDKFNVFETGCKFTFEEVNKKFLYVPYLYIGIEIELYFDGELTVYNSQEEVSSILKIDKQTLLLEESPFFQEEFALLANKSSNHRKVIPVEELATMKESDLLKYEFKTVDIALTFNFTEEPTPTQLYFANGVKISGGKPDTFFKTQLKSIFNQYLKEQKKKFVFETEDLFSNLTFMMAVRLNDPSFSGQTKDKLNNPESGIIATHFLKKYLNRWINRLEKKEMDLILQVLQAAQKARESSAKIKIDAFKSIKSMKENELLAKKGKLEDCSSKDATLNELYIVEGDSASGGIRLSRSPKYQAFIPLKGKPLNVIKKTNQTKIFTNEEINSLSYALGGLGEDFNIEKLKYHKIVVLADADLDGYHIAALMLTFFYHFYPDLIRKGYIYVALAPLFKIAYPKHNEWAWNDEELQEKIKGKRGFELTRNKGLGEMDPADLFDTTLNPKNRKFVQVSMENFNLTKDKINIFMNDEKEGKLALKEIINNYYYTNRASKKIISLTSPETL